MWYAKPSGGYSITSDEAKANMFECKNNLESEWTIFAIAGALGNIANESAFNPWRWQNDTVNYSAGYGLVQFTPASGYINGFPNQANLSTTSVTSGASPNDGSSQCAVLINDSMGKWTNRASYNSWYDLSNFANFSSFKSVNNLYDATMAFLYNYEGNAVVLSRDEALQRADFQIRYDSASTCYEILTGTEPPDPPVPPIPPVPSRTIENNLMKKYIKYGFFF